MRLFLELGYLLLQNGRTSFLFASSAVNSPFISKLVSIAASTQDPHSQSNCILDLSSYF